MIWMLQHSTRWGWTTISWHRTREQAEAAKVLRLSQGWDGFRVIGEPGDPTGYVHD